ncbi:MAG: hypothetical protein D6690_17340 [Nitrospirae bacterium]|nr:MAG: hypothetical protein D6690_17340 [Nitrospirota bacterium]
MSYVFRLGQLMLGRFQLRPIASGILPLSGVTNPDKTAEEARLCVSRSLWLSPTASTLFIDIYAPGASRVFVFPNGLVSMIIDNYLFRSCSP